MQPSCRRISPAWPCIIVVNEIQKALGLPSKGEIFEGWEHPGLLSILPPRSSPGRPSEDPIKGDAWCNCYIDGLALLFPPPKAPAPNLSVQPPTVGQSAERRRVAEQERLEADG